MKQTYLYMWYPLFRAQWDRCNQRNHQSLDLKDSKYMLCTMDNEMMTFHGCNVNASDNQHPQFKIKRLWLRLRGPSEIHMPLLGSPGHDRCTDRQPNPLS